MQRQLWLLYLQSYINQSKGDSFCVSWLGRHSKSLQLGVRRCMIHVR